MVDVSSLIKKHCVPCEGGVEPLKGEKLSYYLSAVPEWKVLDDVKIEREFILKNFKQAMEFINGISKIAEEEGHHPDMFLHDWKKVTITLSTHAIGGLSDNDFILAAKINAIP
jgi:4a-hydroxytetrahydrobiopterin dehydratase